MTLPRDPNIKEPGPERARLDTEASSSSAPIETNSPGTADGGDVHANVPDASESGNERRHGRKERSRVELDDNVGTNGEQVDSGDEDGDDEVDDSGDDGEEDIADSDGHGRLLPKRDGRRAAFLDDLPDAPELRPLIAAFVAGNYAGLRELSDALPSTSDPEVLAAARELVERTMPDPLAKKLLWLSIAFFVALVSWVYLHHAH